MIRFFVSILAAPLAGGAAGFVAMVVVSFFGDEQVWRETLAAAAVVAIYACMIGLAYTLTLGTTAFVYARFTQRTPSLMVALMVGIAAGVLPWAIASFRDHASLVRALVVPALAAVAAAAAAWTFWRIALASRH